MIHRPWFQAAQAADIPREATLDNHPSLIVDGVRLEHAVAVEAGKSAMCRLRRRLWTIFAINAIWRL
jgi:hypothetical protein